MNTGFLPSTVRGFVHTIAMSRGVGSSSRSTTRGWSLVRWRTARITAGTIARVPASPGCLPSSGGPRIRCRERSGRLVEAMGRADEAQRLEPRHRTEYRADAEARDRHDLVD